MAVPPKPAPAPAAASDAATAAVAPVAAKLEKAPKPLRGPLTLAQQRFRLLLLEMTVVVGAIVAVAVFKPDGAIQTAIFSTLGVGFIGPLKDAFRHYFPGGSADDSSTK